MAEIWDADRRIAVCRELTKLYEEVKRGTAAELVPWAEEGVRGEIVIVVEGAAPAVVDEAGAQAMVAELVASGMRLKEAAAQVASTTGMSKRDLYQGHLAK